MNILTISYGRFYVDLLRNSLMKSLMTKSNFDLINHEKTTWWVYTDDEFIEEIEGRIKTFFPAVTPMVKPRSDLRRFNDETQSALVHQIEECLKNKTPLLFAPPDIYIGEGSINGLIKTGWEESVSVVACHLRVTPSFLLEPQPKDNAELVTKAFKHLHRSWIDAELGNPRQNQYGTGVCWQKISDNLYSTIHRLPTPYYIKFTKEDLDYFSTCIGFGNFDHAWPGQILMPRGRQRTVTSSDIAFMVEITEPHKNISALPDNNKNPNDFFEHYMHNEINKQFLFTLRGQDEA